VKKETWLMSLSAVHRPAALHGRWCTDGLTNSKDTYCCPKTCGEGCGAHKCLKYGNLCCRSQVQHTCTSSTDVGCHCPNSSCGGATRTSGPADAKDEAIAALERQVSALQHQLASLSGRRDEPVFVPKLSDGCQGVRPCIHSTPRSRITAGCTNAVWAGSFGGVTQWARVNTTGATTSSMQHAMRPIAPRSFTDRSLPPTPFLPTIGSEACDLTNVWALSKLHHGKRVRDADEAHWHARLRGIKHSLWLSVGSSVDHDVINEACGAFGAERLVIDAEDAPSQLPPELRHGSSHPWPKVLLVRWCHIKPLNLTLAYVAAQGITTTALQRNVSLQRLRFAEIGAQLRRIGEQLPSAGVYAGGPTFVTYAGIEWDFKNWRCLYPHTSGEWSEPLRILRMQIGAMRAEWPGVRAVFARTMFKPTSGNFDCECCAKEADFFRYNDLLRAWNTARAGADDDQECERVHVLDLQRMMPCNDSVGTCSGRTGWTDDGLHPSGPVLCAGSAFERTRRLSSATLGIPTRVATEIPQPSTLKYSRTRVLAF
jgi:hypothetical protein